MAQPNPSWLAAALGEQDTAAVAPTQYTSPSADEDTEQDDDDIGFDPTQDTEDLDDDDDDDDDDEEDGEYLGMHQTCSGGRTMLIRGSQMRRRY